MVTFIHDKGLFTLDEFLDVVDEAYSNEEISFEEKRSILLKIKQLNKAKDEVKVAWLKELRSGYLECSTYRGWCDETNKIYPRKSTT